MNPNIQSLLSDFFKNIYFLLILESTALWNKKGGALNK